MKFEPKTYEMWLRLINTSVHLMIGVKFNYDVYIMSLNKLETFKDEGEFKQNYCYEI